MERRNLRSSTVYGKPSEALPSSQHRAVPPYTVAAIRDELRGVSSKAVANHGRAPGTILLIRVRSWRGPSPGVLALYSELSLCMISFHSRLPVQGSVTRLVCRCCCGRAEGSADTAWGGQPASPGTEPQGLPDALWCWGSEGVSAQI